MEGSSNVFCIRRKEGSLVMFFCIVNVQATCMDYIRRMEGSPILQVSFCKSRPCWWHLLVVPPVNWGEWKCQRHFFGVSGADINHQNSRRPIIHISKWALLGSLDLMKNWWIWWKCMSLMIAATTNHMLRKVDMCAMWSHVVLCAMWSRVVLCAMWSHSATNHWI